MNTSGNTSHAMNRIIEDLRTYVKSWNNNSPSHRLTFYADDASIYTQDGCKLIELRRLSRSDLLSNLEGSSFSTRDIHKFLSDLSNISWNWHPKELRSNVFSPALEEYRNQFPRAGYARPDMSHLGIIEWKRSREECEQTVRSLPGSAVYAIYVQNTPEAEVMPPTIVRTGAYAAPPPVVVPFASPSPPPLIVSPLPREEVDLDGIADIEAEDDGLSCAVCMTNKPCIAAECGHLTVCAGCAQRISKGRNPRCPKCRGDWTGLRRIFI